MTVPLAEPPEGAYRQRHLDIQLDSRQAEALRRMFDGLHASAAKLANDWFVNTPGDAVRWMLERLAEGGGQ